MRSLLVSQMSRLQNYDLIASWFAKSEFHEFGLDYKLIVWIGP